ncbi:exodeoxyribonuclease V subunit alpha [Azohydromonas aeria]|uniref:exodeoxyribonuclease V subunit alpha n=1 Tax=Azohydromonas aeria TaxID=2590212 RepID=UPI0012FCE940|nr:exodeoxyribonuclease V subunit alpha [Azohydromonas aeria]
MTSAIATNTVAEAAAPLADTAALLSVIERWARHGWLREIDAAFTAFLAREVPDAAPLTLLAAALASHQLGHGHACLDIEQALRDPGRALSLPPPGDDLAQDEAPPRPDAVLLGVTATDWCRVLHGQPALVGSAAGDTPLVCVGRRVYLRRYWSYERGVRAGIEARLGRVLPFYSAALREPLARLFPHDPAASGPDWQQLACALAARSAFAVVTGGPGTGKTTTVVRLLALLQALALAEPGARALRIRLAAPTGKAAARLSQSIAGAVARLPLEGLPQAEAVRTAIPSQVTTLHRLLGSRPDTRRFKHHAGQPLPVDVLVVDEASMVDLEMMSAVLDALPPAARLVLLGDKDQLASVEAGSVLGELCRRAEAGHYTPATGAWLAELTGAPIEPRLVDAQGTALDQAVAMLRHSHRFGADSGIGRLAAAVNAGDLDAVQRVLGQGHAELARVALTPGQEAALRCLAIEGGGDESARGYRHFLQVLHERQPAPGAGREELDAWAAAVLDAYGQFQLLCALRRGPWGVEGLNRRVADWLCEAGLIPRAEGWYAGRPVLVTRNDYGLGLMNGDIGITLEWPAADGPGVLRVAFAAEDGTGIRWVLPSRLSAVETVFAMTVHKSQGSEFTHAALVLPDRGSPVLTRELVYTGITRAKRWFSLVETGDAGVLRQAVQRRVQRFGGLLAVEESVPGPEV